MSQCAPLAVQVDAAPGRGVTVSLADLFSLNLRARAQLRDTVLSRTVWSPTCGAV